MEVLNLATMEKQDEILSKPIGTNFINTNFISSATILETHYGNTAVDIVGKGILHALYNRAPSVSNISIQIDGGQIQQVNLSVNTSIIIMGGFHSSLLVKSSQPAGHITVIYSLGV